MLFIWGLLMSLSLLFIVLSVTKVKSKELWKDLILCFVCAFSFLLLIDKGGLPPYLSTYYFIILISMVFFDIKTQEIPDSLQVLLLIGSMYSLVIYPKTILEVFLAVVPGCVLLLYYYTSENIGGADGKIMISIGLFVGLSGTLGVLFYACLLACGFYFKSIILKDMKRKIPFIPFLAAGVLLQMSYPIFMISFYSALI